MKITVESTSRIVEVDGVLCRAWEGTTERGVEVSVLIPRVRARHDADTGQLDRELLEMRAPRDATQFPWPGKLKL